MHPKGLIYLYLIAIFAAFSSCQTNTVYDKVLTIDKGNWDKDKSAHFEMEISDSVSSYDFYITVHNTTDYRFSNLFVFMTTHFPNGNVTRDTLECILADASGKWFGKGWGHVKEIEVLLKENLVFPLTGKYDFYIQQAMRTDTLTGINRIGIRLDKSD